MSEYLAIPALTATTFEPVTVALTAATLKTVIQVATPSTTDIRVVGWGVSFDGVSGTATPVIAHLIDCDNACTGGTSLTPVSWGNPGSAASLCVGGTALTMYNAGAEVSPTTAVRMLDAQLVHPQAGYGVYFPEVRVQPRVAASRFLRIRCNAPANVNVIPWVLWAEPAI